MTAYRQVDDLYLPAGWLPVHRDQLRAQRSVTITSIYGKHFFTSRGWFAAEFSWAGQLAQSALLPRDSKLARYML